jgi:PPOX class probable F420-dependent enzyme
MALNPKDLSEEVRSFLSDRHLATLSISRPDGTIHSSPIGVTWDNEAQLARVITWTGSKKARLLIETPGAVAVCHVDGGRWLTLEGSAIVRTDAESCAEGVRRYAQRYRQPKERSDRAVIEISVTRMLGRV